MTKRTQHEKPACVLDSHLLFLDKLRESGITNMFGAAPYLMEAFGLNRKDGQMVLAYWMESFVERHGDQKENTEQTG
jgi:hypothetical protein